MSFAFASYNDYGIVVSADRCLTGINNKGEKYTTSSNKCRKLFISKQGFAITYTGCSSINDHLIPAKISELWETVNIPKGLKEFFEEFIKIMSAYCKENIVFIVAGYENGSPKIYTATSTRPQIVEMEDLAYSGETDIAKKVINAVPIVYNTMTIQDRIDFHRFITHCISKYQYYSDCLQTVSEECDIVVISKTGVAFSKFAELC